jgi:hypothetical protein
MIGGISRGLSNFYTSWPINSLREAQEMSMTRGYVTVSDKLQEDDKPDWMSKSSRPQRDITPRRSPGSEEDLPSPDYAYEGAREFSQLL